MRRKRSTSRTPASPKPLPACPQCESGRAVRHLLLGQWVCLDCKRIFQGRHFSEGDPFLSFKVARKAGVEV